MSNASGVKVLVTTTLSAEPSLRNAYDAVVIIACSNATKREAKQSVPIVV